MGSLFLRKISENGKAFKQQVRCNLKGSQRLRQFVLSQTKLCSAESINLCGQITIFLKNQKEVLRLTCYLNTLDYCTRAIKGCSWIVATTLKTA